VLQGIGHQFRLPAVIARVTQNDIRHRVGASYVDCPERHNDSAANCSTASGDAVTGGDVRSRVEGRRDISAALNVSSLSTGYAPVTMSNVRLAVVDWLLGPASVT
jgi:hypothetical protein